MLPLALNEPQEDALEVLCLGAHCDDIEIGCGGTVLRLVEEFPNARFHWVVLSSNDDRAGEAQAAAEHFLAAAGKQDIRIERDEEVSDAAVVIGGNLDVAGRVRDGIVVVGGDLHLASTADVRGDIVLVGGTISREAGARQVGNINYVSFGRWWSRELGWWPTIRFGEFGRWIALAGTLARVSVLAVLMIAVLLAIVIALLLRQTL